MREEEEGGGDYDILKPMPDYVCMYCPTPDSLTLIPSRASRTH